MTLMLRVIHRASALAGLALALLNCGPAQALPSFTRQTGSECAACHIGAYGPHLTAFGQQFKIAGYTDTGGGQGANAVPLAARLRLNNINPVRGASDTRVDEADIYLAGRVLGLTAYAYVDKAWYVEVGGYRAMSRGLQDRLRLDPAAKTPAPWTASRRTGVSRISGTSRARRCRWACTA